MTGAIDLSAVAALLLDAGLKATFILLAALGATRLMRRWPAASRHLVWAVALAAVLALPALGRVMPEWKALPIPAFLRQAPAVQPPAAEPSPQSTDASPNAAAPAGAANAVTTSASPPAVSSPAVSSPAISTPAVFDWQLALMILWAAGVALLVLRLGYGLVRVAWMERRAVEITDEEWVRTVDRLARRLRVGRMVTLLREAHASVPMTWGVLHPVVLLPAEADGWDAERRTVVLAHELAHVRRWDPLTQWLAHLALAVFWFHPLVWVAARKMREERERACDDAVIALGTRPVRYADHLLDIVRSLGSAEGPAAALAMARRSQFEGRLLAILDSATPRGGASTAVGLAALVVAAVAVVPLAALRAAEPPVQTAVKRADPSARKLASALPVKEERAEPVKERSILDRVADGLDAVVGRARETQPGPAPGTSAPPQAPAPAALPPPASTGVAADRPVVAMPLPAAEGERADLLVRMAAAQEGGDELYLQVIRAAESIGSSSERAEVLLAVLRRPELSTPVVVAALRAASGIASDANRRDVLKAVASRRSLGEPAVLRAFMDAVAAMASGAERRDVLKTVAGRPAQTSAVLQAVVTSSRAIPSSAERRDVMLAVLEHPSLAEPVLLGVIAATREIPSGAERRDVLRRILARRTLGEAVLVAVFDASCEIPSSAERRDVLLAAAGRRDLTARARAEYLEAARTIPSEAERTAAITALLGDEARTSSRQDDQGTWNASIGLTLDHGRSVRIEAKDVVRDGNPLVIRRIRPGGSLVIEETVRGRVRRLEITPGADGELRRSFRVDREYRTFDSAAQIWMTDILREFTQ